MCTVPCAKCPMRKATPQGHRRLLVEGAPYSRIVAAGGFPCHEKHPEEHALTATPYAVSDCVGYKMYLGNKKAPGRFTDIVDDILKE